MTKSEAPAAPKPTVGRVVHYVSYGTPGGEFSSVCRAATVTEVRDLDETVGLCVMNPTGLFFHALSGGGSRHDEDGKAGGTWHWPERA